VEEYQEYHTFDFQYLEEYSKEVWPKPVENRSENVGSKEKTTS